MSNHEQNTSANKDSETQKAGCFVIDHHGRILLAKDPRYVYWSLPKGHAESGETLEETAIRETLEETGWEVHITKSLGEHRYVHPLTQERIAMTVFLADPVKYVHRGQEYADWFMPDVVKAKLYPNLIQFLEKHGVL